MIYSNRLVVLHIKMATRLVFAGRWTEKRRHCTFVFMGIIQYQNAITCLKALLCGCTCKNIFRVSIQPMQFVGKQHNLTLKETLKALIVLSQ